MPGIASGRTTWRIVCHFVEPSARLPLALVVGHGPDRLLGEARHQRQVEDRQGQGARPSAVKLQRVAFTNSASPNRPTTIEGTRADQLLAEPDRGS